MVSDSGVVVIPLCIPTAQGLLGSMAPELIFPLPSTAMRSTWALEAAAVLWLAEPLLAQMTYLTHSEQNLEKKDWSCPHLPARHCWTIIRNGLIAVNKGKHILKRPRQGCQDTSHCSAMLRVLLWKFTGGAQGQDKGQWLRSHRSVCLSFREPHRKGHQDAFVLPATLISNTRGWVWDSPSSLGTNNPSEEQPEKCDTAVEEMQQWIHATAPTLDTARAAVRRESEVTVQLSRSTGWIQDTGTA